MAVDYKKKSLHSKAPTSSIKPLAPFLKDAVFWPGKCMISMSFLQIPYPSALPVMVEPSTFPNETELGAHNVSRTPFQDRDPWFAMFEIRGAQAKQPHWGTFGKDSCGYTCTQVSGSRKWHDILLWCPNSWVHYGFGHFQNCHASGFVN